MNLQTLYVESDSSLTSFNTIYNLYHSLLNSLGKAALLEIQHKYETDISMIFNYFNNEINNPEYNSPQATIELQAIMLRLSRHHIKKAKIVDNVSRFIVDAMAYGVSNSLLDRIQFRSSELIDRPSLMIINRILELIKINELKIDITFLFNKKVLGLNNNESVIKARNQVFEKLNKYCKFIFGNSEEHLEITIEDFTLKNEQYNEKILDAAVIEQNFELAQIILLHSLNNKSDNKIVTDQLAYRILGVIEANLGDFKKSIEFLDLAIENSQNIIEFSRNSYIKGLCLIKRLKRVEEGIEIIEKALEKLAKDYKDDVKYKHEKAWLINGLCLGRTIIGNKLNGKEKESFLQNIIKEEMNAYKLLKGNSNHHLIYLKFNLLANIAFLLEILEDYPNAIKFWEKAFAPILASDGQYKEGEKSITYRLGILYVKQNDLKQAELLLERSLLLVRHEKNRFHLNAILYAYAYVKLLNGDKSKDINQLLNEGKKLSKDLNDKEMLLKYESALKYFYGEIEIHKLVMPNIKLISYIPQLDLSFAPEIDMNRYLTNV